MQASTPSGVTRTRSIGSTPSSTRALVRLGASAVLAQSISSLIHSAVLLRTYGSFDEEAMRRSVNHHIEIAAAIRAGRPGMGGGRHARPPVLGQGVTAGSPSTGEPVMRGLPLADLRVVELGQLLAGPFCGQLLGDFGAEVIKVEDPGRGDPMRQWGREKPHGKSLWWPVVARNKKSVTCDLRTAEGQELVRRLIEQADVLLENFRPGTLERWGLSPERAVRDQPPAGHHPGHRLRPDRPVRAARRLRLDRRGDGRHPLRHRRPRPAAVARRHLARRLARRHATPASAPWSRCTSATAPAGARSSTRRSTRPCSR